MPSGKVEKLKRLTSAPSSSAQPESCASVVFSSSSVNFAIRSSSALHLKRACHSPFSAVYHCIAVVLLLPPQRAKSEGKRPEQRHPDDDGGDDVACTPGDQPRHRRSHHTRRKDGC